MLTIDRISIETTLVLCKRWRLVFIDLVSSPFHAVEPRLSDHP